MKPTIAVLRPAHDSHTQQARMQTITLPYVHGVDITQDRSETAPRTVAIRGEMKWQRDKVLAMAARVRS